MRIRIRDLFDSGSGIKATSNIKRQYFVQIFFVEILLNTFWIRFQIWIQNQKRNRKRNFSNVGTGTAIKIVTAPQQHTAGTGAPLPKAVAREVHMMTSGERSMAAGMARPRATKN